MIKIGLNKVFLLLLFASFSVFGFSIDNNKSNIVVLNEDITIYENGEAKILLKIQLQNQLKQLLLPLFIESNNRIDIISKSERTKAQLIQKKGSTIIEFSPQLPDTLLNRNLIVELAIASYVQEEGRFFYKKSVALPVISNNDYINTIDYFRARIIFPANYNFYIRTIETDFKETKISLSDSLLSSPQRVLMLSSSNINLKTNNKPLILSTGVTPLFLILVIIGLLIFYALFFTNLFNFR